MYYMHIMSDESANCKSQSSLKYVVLQEYRGIV
jgi:hypothetical protein